MFGKAAAASLAYIVSLKVKKSVENDKFYDFT